MKKDNRGGKRSGSGRKPTEKSELKEPITIYIKSATIEQHGGKQAAKQELTNYINNKTTN